MDGDTRRILGKRGRRAMDPPQSAADLTTPPKRPRARRHERVEAKARVEAAAPEDLTPKVPSRSGLLTPEPSTLSESQLPDALDAKAPLSPRHIFPFMSLPAELRLHVYAMALVRPTPLYLHAQRPAQSDEQDSASASAMPVSIANTINTSHSSPALPRRPPRASSSSPERPRQHDPIVPAILRLNKQIHKEARQLLYAENVFTLSLSSGIHTLSTLHQRSRSLIKHVILTIPSHHDILDGFADLVRLGLRYCWGLKSFKIILQASLPDDGRVSGATSVYANAFHILRWLPRGCSVALEGCVSETVRRVVLEEGRLMNVLDEVSWSHYNYVLL
tara:strand:- start:17614 stop:18612 length:999 start_codon:yes stop_codon:yes gene_type:complete